MGNSLKRLLLVEDNMNDIELILTAFKEYNFANEVVVVQDGEEALDFLHCRGKYALRIKGNPIVILLDIKLKKINGIEVLKHIKSEEKLRLIPVVMLTSSREEKDVIESYTLGANAYVVKPVDFKEFVHSVRELGIFWAMINEPPSSVK
ncbi:MAG: response regulator [Desulfobacterales bacterium]|nr:response regulator [Desulfobacterales bacterium]